jgi:hypothetical protein
VCPACGAELEATPLHEELVRRALLLDAEVRTVPLASGVAATFRY